MSERAPESPSSGGGTARPAPPSVSVLLPCRDAASHLPAAIASLEAQTLSAFEVLAVDDGSRDETARVLESWARRDGRVRVLARSGDGLVAALRAAADHARAPLLARMDADDVAHPRRLELQVALMRAQPGIAACGTRVRYFPREHVRDGARRYEAWINGLVEPEAIARDAFVECPIPHPTLVLRRDAFDAVGGYRETGWPEDYDLVLRLWRRGERLAKVPRVLLRWRERPDRASRTDARYSPDAFRRCKVHHLRRGLLPPERDAVVWGAGPVGKRFARELLRQGARVAAFVDVDPRKIGQQVHGAPVIPPADVGRLRGALVLGAVGSPGGRRAVRTALGEMGWRELEDFVAVA